MTESMEAYAELDPMESFDEFEGADEATILRTRGRKVSVPAGLSSTATLLTQKGPAQLTLPRTVATFPQIQVLQQAVNANTQRVNAVQAALARMHRQAALRPADSFGQSTMFLLFTLMNQKKVREDLEGHTHGTSTDKAVLPATSGSSFSSLLPLMMFMPGMFGQPSTGSTQDGMSPLMMLFLLDL